MDRLPATASQLSVLDMTGRTVLVQPLTEGVQRPQIDVRNLAAGTYLLRIDATDEVITKRFVRQ